MCWKSIWEWILLGQYQGSDDDVFLDTQCYQRKEIGPSRILREKIDVFTAVAFLLSQDILPCVHHRFFVGLKSSQTLTRTVNAVCVGCLHSIQIIVKQFMFCISLKSDNWYIFQWFKILFAPVGFFSLYQNLFVMYIFLICCDFDKI